MVESDEVGEGADDVSGRNHGRSVDDLPVGQSHAGDSAAGVEPDLLDGRVAADLATVAGDDLGERGTQALPAATGVGGTAPADVVAQELGERNRGHGPRSGGQGTALHRDSEDRARAEPAGPHEGDERQGGERHRPGAGADRPPPVRGRRGRGQVTVERLGQSPQHGDHAPQATGVLGESGDQIGLVGIPPAGDLEFQVGAADDVETIDIERQPVHPVVDPQASHQGRDLALGSAVADVVDAALELPPALAAEDMGAARS